MKFLEFAAQIFKMIEKEYTLVIKTSKLVCCVIDLMSTNVSSFVASSPFFVISAEYLFEIHFKKAVLNLLYIYIYKIGFPIMQTLKCMNGDCWCCRLHPFFNQ